MGYIGHDHDLYCEYVKVLSAAGEAVW